jgi:hypothetical protein
MAYNLLAQYGKIDGTDPHDEVEVSTLVLEDTLGSVVIRRRESVEDLSSGVGCNSHPTALLQR